jgi:hypothetical protein
VATKEREKQEIQERFRTVLELFDAGVDMMRQNLRRRFPSASDETIEEKLSDWLSERPGAEYGDAVGRPVQLVAPGVRLPLLSSRRKKRSKKPGDPTL